MNKSWTEAPLVKTLPACISVLLVCHFTGALFHTSLSGNAMHSSWECGIVFHYLSTVIYSFYILSLNLCILLYISALTLYSYPLYHSIHPFPPSASPHLQLCSIYYFCLVSIFSLSSFHALKPISLQSPFQHLVFSLYHRWSTFHAGLLHGLMPSLCVYAVCVLFVSPACHSETHCFV